MTFTGLHSAQYSTGRELGRGGEGVVYEVAQQDLVLKMYNEPLTPARIAKLKEMLAMRTPAIEAYAAWPTDVVADDKGNLVGFVMRKLGGYLPLHMIFSPMDRKKMFPDKGYNFLMHIARNLATAFHRLHEAGLVVGDVNEGNILINAAGLVAFIDCDSFQVRSGSEYFYCEVGVPRYTPPELLSKGSFEQVVRTINTDSFSLAVLIFQLLFLGRHPFAGKNKLAGDFDEETAIRKREFAYSLENKRKKLFPPNDSFSITNLSPELVTFFHRAFEQDDRPTPSDWVRALDAQLLSMVTCGVSRLHSYPSVMTDCPWCAFQKSKGIMYFLDDSYLKATAFLGDIAGFVNGFNVEKLELRSWDKQIDFSGVGPSVIEKKYYTYRTLRWGSVAALVIFAIISLALHVNPIGATLAVFLSFALYLYSPWAARLNAQLKLLSGIQTQLSDKLKAMIAEYNTPADYANYTKSLAALQKYVSDFRRLPDEFDRRRKLMEEQAYNEQLYQYLDQFTVDAHEIPSFGAAKKTTLVSHGIRTAAEVSKLINTRVPGIGPKNLQVLLSWQRQMGSGFTYVPDNNLLTVRLQEVTSDMATIRSRLESLIRKEYQSLNYLRLNITNRASLLERQIIDLSILAYRASLDVAAFRRLAA